MTHKVAWWYAVTAYACPVCHVAPGEACISTSGAAKSEPHAERARLASEHHWKDPDEEEAETDEPD